MTNTNLRPPHFHVLASADVRQFVRFGVRHIARLRLLVRREGLDRPEAETNLDLRHPRLVNVGVGPQADLLQPGQ